MGGGRYQRTYTSTRALQPHIHPHRQQTLHQQASQQVSPLRHIQAEDVDAGDSVEGKDVEEKYSTKINQRMDVYHRQQEET